MCLLYSKTAGTGSLCQGVFAVAAVSHEDSSEPAVGAGSGQLGSLGAGGRGGLGEGLGEAGQGAGCWGGRGAGEASGQGRGGQHCQQGGHTVSGSRV